MTAVARKDDKTICRRFTAVLLAITLLFPLPGLAWGATDPDFDQEQLLSARVRELENFLKLVRVNYKDQVDYEALVDGAFSGVIGSLGDPYSAFMGEADEGAAPEDRVVGEFTGIGAQLGTDSRGRCYVVSVLEGGPAEKAGIVDGDIIIKVDGEDVTSLTSVEISRMLRGDEGSSVSVTVKMRSDELTYEMKRETMAITISFYEMKEGDVGYIKIKSFEPNSHPEFVKAMEALMDAGAKSLIVDLRDNPGGYLNPALAIADEFIEDGVMLHMRQKGAVTRTVRATARPKAQIPVAVIVNENSASSAEVLAAAMQDSGAALLVGTATYGKGAAQVRRQTDGGSPFMVSTYELLRPNGRLIEGVGVTPDHEVRNKLGAPREDAAKSYESFAPFAEGVKHKRGDTGLNVFAAQQRLILLGYEIEPTAVMDGPTVEAIKRFQREHGLYPYGELDFTTMGRIAGETLAYIGNDSKEDLQLLKAVELLQALH